MPPQSGSAHHQSNSRPNLPSAPRRRPLPPRAFFFADLRFADEALRLPGTTRSSSRTENPADVLARDGPSKLGSMRLSLRSAMP
jgi:hypothetical protein